MRTVCEQTVSKGAPLAVSRAPDGYTGNAPIFKLCFRSSAPFAGVLDPGASSAAARRRPPPFTGVAVAVAVGRLVAGLHPRGSTRWLVFSDVL
jgi:hypothetical protein